jgi:hypothetical protein
MPEIKYTGGGFRRWIISVLNNMISSAYFGDDDNNTAFDDTGHQTMEGDAKPWRDELGDAAILKSVGPGVSANTSESTVVFATNANLSDYLYTNIQLNHDKDLECAIYPHIHWFQAEDRIPNFLLQYRWQINGNEKEITWNYIICNNIAFSFGAATTRNQICYSSKIEVPVGSTISDIVQFRILRDTNNDSAEFSGVDPYTTAVHILAFDVHFQINSLGSTEQFVK